MFRHMRLKDNQLSHEAAEKIMTEQPHGTLALIGDEGYPYAVPLNFVYRDGKIYFHGAVAGHKFDAMKRNNKVSFCVISKDDIVASEFNTLYESAIAFGKVRILEGDEKRSGLMAIIKKYCAEYLESGAKYVDDCWDEVACYEIDVESLTGKFGTPE